MPAEEDCPWADEKDEQLEGEGDQHAVAGNVALQVLQTQAKHSQLNMRESVNNDDIMIVV